MSWTGPIWAAGRGGRGLRGRFRWCRPLPGVRVWFRCGRRGRLCTNIPSLREDDSEEEDDKEYGCADPAVGSEWCRCIQVGLVLLNGMLARDSILVVSLKRRNSYSSKSGGMRGHRCERRLLRLRDIHGDGTGTIQTIGTSSTSSAHAD